MKKYFPHFLSILFFLVFAATASSQNTVTTLQPVITLDTNAVCAGSVIDVPFYSTGSYILNTYAAQLSDINGNFLPYPLGTTLGTFNSDITYDPSSPTPGYPPPGNVAGLIPDTVSPGCNYYIRVIATGPATPPGPVLGTVWGPFCIQQCDIITNNEQDIQMCVNPPNDSCILIPVNINFYDSTSVYAPGNQFRVQLISRGPIPPPMTEIGLPGILGSVTATNDANLSLCIYADSLQAWGIPSGSYYLRIVATNSSVPENSLGSIVRFTFGSPATVAPSFSAYDYPSFTPLASNSVCQGDYVMFILNTHNQSSTYNWYLNTLMYPRPPNSFLVWFNAPGPVNISVRENNLGCLGPLSPVMTITSIGPPNVNIAGPANICVGDTVQYSVPLGNSTFYLWDFSGDTLFSTGSNQAQIVTSAPGTDTIYVIANNQCFTADSFKVVDVHASPPVPLITQIGNMLICSVSNGVTYRWFRNNIWQAQYTNDTIIITSAENGIWNVEVRNILSPFCNAFSTIIEVDVGIDKLENYSGIIIMPNPVTDELFVAGYALSEKTEITIYSALGEKVFTQQQTTNGNRQSINISFLAPGIYLVKVRGEKEERTAKLLKK